jgi:hypothetical protein
MSTSYVSNQGTASVGPALAPSAEPELGDIESTAVARLGGRASLFGGIQIVSGALTVLGGVLRGVNLTTVLIGLFPMLIGASFIAAGASLRAVRSTRGSDAQHLVRGVNALSRALFVSLMLAIFGAGTTFIGGVFTGYRDAAARHGK